MPPRKHSDNEGTVILLDLLSIAPYYDFYLANALRKLLSVRLSAVDPFQDWSLFRNGRVARTRYLLNIAGRLKLRNRTVRRLVAAVEYITNLAVHLLFFVLSPPRLLHIQWLPVFQYTRFSFELSWLRIIRARGIPIVLTVHNLTPHERPNEVARFRKLYALCDALICHTEASRQRLIADFGVQPDVVHVIPHGPLLHDASEQDAPTASAPLTVAAIGTIRPYKGLDVLLRAWRQVVAAIPDAELLIAGDGPAAYVGELAEIASSPELRGRVRIIARPLTTAEVTAAHRGAAVIALPYRDITQSGALLTAMAFGKPVVLTSLPAFAETLPEYPPELLVKPGDENELAAALLLLLRSPERRSELGAVLQSRVLRDYSWPQIAEKTKVVYASLGRMTHS